MDEEQEKILKEFACLCSSDEKVDKHLKVMREAAITCIKEFEKGTKMNNEEKKMKNLEQEMLEYVIDKIREEQKNGNIKDARDCYSLLLSIITNLIMFELLITGKEYTKMEKIEHVTIYFKDVLKLVEAVENKKLH